MGKLQEIKVANLIATWAGLPGNLRNDTNISTLVIKHFLGFPWIEKHLDPDASNPGILTLKGNPSDLELAKIRIIDLAETLFNLRRVKGLNECLQRMQTVDNIEPTLAELHIGKMLYANDWTFRFVSPSGGRGDDYDLQIRYWNQAVCGDVKCKIESPIPDSNSITRTLTRSRDQLPADKPGVFFVKFPQSWMEHPDWQRTTVQGALDFFAQGTGRIISVAFYVEPIRLIGMVTEEGRHYVAQQGHYFYEIANPRRRFCQHVDCKFFEVWRPTVHASWSAMPPKYIRLFEFPKGMVGHEKE